MMPKVNKIANPDFSQGKKAPRGWVWTVKGGRSRWRRDGATGIIVESKRAGESAHWSQVVVCKPEQFYRVEAAATCELEASSDAGGLVLRVEPLVNGRRHGIGKHQG